MHGLCAPGSEPSAFILAAAAPVRTAGNAFDRSAQSEAKTAALLREATRTFNRGGYDNVSVDAVAGSLGVTKGAFYHYFSSKQELLFRCYERTLDLTRDCLPGIEAEGGDGLTCLRTYVSRAIALQAGPAGPLAILNRALSLTPEQRVSISLRGREQQLIVQAFIERGMRDGSIRDINPRMARLAVVGALNWLPKWHNPAGHFDADEVAVQFDRFFVYGLKPG